MPTVTLSETYDLSTKLNKMSMVGIHTPNMALIRKTYPGLVLNNRFMKILKCDVKLACATVLPADPQAVGVEAGDIAPQDMFNPILYKAVSNQGMSNFEARLNGLRQTADANKLSGPSVDAINEDVNDNYGHDPDDFRLYYSLLANHKGFKVAHPQAGLSMRGLRPFVYEKYFDNGENKGYVTTDNAYHVIGEDAESEANYQPFKGQARYAMFGRAHPLPKINTMFVQTGLTEENISEGIIGYKPTDIMPIYCGLILLPPAKLHTLYYRLVVRWHVSFFGARPVQEIDTFNTMAGQVSTFYGSDYVFASKGMGKFTDMVDTQCADIEKIMEGA